MTTTINYVVGFAWTPAGELILIRKNRPKFQAGKLNGVGGKIELGETPLEAMRREFREETGVDVENWINFATVDTGNGEVSDRALLYVFAARLSREQADAAQTVTDEIVERWPPESLDGARVMRNVHWLVPMARDVVWRGSPARFHVYEEREPLIIEEGACGN